MKHIKLLITFMLLTCFAYANGSSTLLEQMRAEKVEKFKINIDAISIRVNNYILNTAETNIIRSNIQKFDNLPYQFFNNFSGVSCTNNGTYCSSQSGNDGIQISLVNKSLVLKNVLGSNPNTYVTQTFLSNNDNSRTVTNEDGYTVTIPLDTKTSMFMDLIERIKVIPSSYIGTVAPTDKTKTWYFPNGNGTFDIKKWNASTNKWEDVGSTGVTGQSNIQASSEEELNKIPCLKNDTGFVLADGDASQYICSASGDWNKLSGGSSAFNGSAEMLQLVTSLMKKEGGSVATVEDAYQTGVKHTYSGVKDFVKKDNTANNGYWISPDNLYIATDSYQTLSKVSLSEGAVAYLPNENLTAIEVLKRINGNWIYVANGYKDIVENYSFLPNNVFVQDLKNTEKYFFKRSDKSFISVNIIGANNSTKNNKIIMSNNDRNHLQLLGDANTQYLLAYSDCLSTNCNKPTSPFFAGDMLDGMFVFYYTTSTTAKNKNRLIDATPVSNMSIAYSNQKEAVLWNGNVYIKGTDTNNRLCYHNTKAFPEYITGDGAIIPTGNNLPIAKTCANAVYSGSYLVLDNRTQATNWTTAPNGAAVQIGGTNYVHRLSGNLDFWTNNNSGDGQISASEIFTKGTRANFPPVTKSITALTKGVDTPNYTTTGVTSSVDNTFKQWYYSNSGTKVNNLLDNPCLKIAGYTANFNTASCDQSQYRDYGIYLTKRWTNGSFWNGQYKNGTYKAYDDSHSSYYFDTGWLENTNNYTSQTWTNSISGYGVGIHYREIRIDKKYFNNL